MIEWGNSMKKNDWLTAFLLLVIAFLSLSLIDTRLNLGNNVKEIELKEISVEKKKIIFAGDSITDRYNLDKFYNYDDKLIINSGIGGYTTDNILKRFHNLIEQHQADKMFLMIGTNDIGKGMTEDYIIENIIKIIEETKQKSPNTKIYVESIYPVNLSKRPKDKARNNQIITRLNTRIEEYCKNNNITYINVYNTLIDSEGNLDASYTDDGLHLNDYAYSLVTRQLKPYVEE